MADNNFLRSKDRRKRSIHIKGTFENRQAVAEECWRNAALSLGEITKGYRKFIVTRGQFGQIDAILHIMKYVHPAHVSIWNWGVGRYDMSCLDLLMQRGEILSIRLFVDIAAKNKDHEIMDYWAALFGAGSIRYIINHAKMARIWNDEFKILLRGSANLNFNPRYEQFDIGDGEPGFDLVAQLEEEILAMPAAQNSSGAYAASKLGRAADNAAGPQFGISRTMRDMQLKIWKPELENWGQNEDNASDDNEE